MALDSVLAGCGYAVLRRWRNENETGWHAPFAPAHVCNVFSAEGGHYVVMTADGTVLDPDDPAPRRLSDYLVAHDVAGVFKVV